MPGAVDHWLTASATPEAPREQAAMLAVALEDHAAREERLVLDPQRTYSPEAHRIGDMMAVIHDEVRGLFAELADWDLSVWLSRQPRMSRLSRCSENTRASGKDR
jgi:hypothetical protein